MIILQTKIPPSVYPRNAAHSPLVTNNTIGRQSYKGKIFYSISREAWPKPPGFSLTSSPPTNLTPGIQAFHVLFCSPCHSTDWHQRSSGSRAHSVLGTSTEVAIKCHQRQGYLMRLPDYFLHQDRGQICCHYQAGLNRTSDIEAKGLLFLAALWCWLLQVSAQDPKPKP